MTKKRSAYAKKKIRELNTEEKVTSKIMDQMCGLSRVIARSQPFAGNPIYKPEKMLVPVRTALQKLLDRTMDGRDTQSFDTLKIGRAHV